MTARSLFFVARPPARIDRTVELGERHVVPAYGEAHHHGIDFLGR